MLDTFAGSGTTGLATLLCDKPTEELKRMVDRLKLKPKWGPRTSVLYELGVLGAFVSKTMCNPPNPVVFEAAANKLISDVDASVGWMYSSKDSDGMSGTIRHVIWSDVLVCPHCGSESLYSDVAVKKNPLRFINTFICPHCGHETDIDQVNHVTESKNDPLNKSKFIGKKREQAIIYGHTKGKNWQRISNEDDAKFFSKIERLEIPKHVPNTKINWGELQRNGYHQGITHIHHFYTRRNLLVFAKLWESINTFDPDIQDALRLLVLSYNSSHATLMTRVVAKKNQNDFVLTGAQSGILYISSLPVEKNIIIGLRRKLKTFRDAFSVVYGSTSKVCVVNESSTKLNMKNKSVDYVFTDPPFGDYIPYAELSQINEAWLGKVTIRDNEVIISPSQNKDVSAYALLMGNVFSEISRVLKDDAKATLVFHSAKAAVWRAMADAYKGAGLKVIASSVLDKLQVSFKQVVSSISVKGDPLLLLVKQDKGNITYNVEITQHTNLIDEVINKASLEVDNSKERTAERLYSRYISRCLEMGIVVTMNAESFYDYVRRIEGIR